MYDKIGYYTIIRLDTEGRNIKGQCHKRQKISKKVINKSWISDSTSWSNGRISNGWNIFGRKTILPWKAKTSKGRIIGLGEKLIRPKTQQAKNMAENVCEWTFAHTTLVQVHSHQFLGHIFSFRQKLGYLTIKRYIFSLFSKGKMSFKAFSLLSFYENSFIF